jgi:hypothetical protein
LARHPCRRQCHFFQSDDHTGEFAAIAFQNQLAAPSFSSFLASGDGSVAALSQRITR